MIGPDNDVVTADNGRPVGMIGATGAERGRDPDALRKPQPRRIGSLFAFDDPDRIIWTRSQFV